MSETKPAYEELEARLAEAEAALNEREEQYRLLSENIPVVVYSALPDEHSTSLFVSGSIVTLTGYSAQEFLEAPELFGAMLHPEDREYVWEKIAEHRERKTALDVEYRIVTRDKTVKWVRNRGTPTLDAAGEIVRIDGLMEDITERRRAQRRLQRSEQELRTLAERLLAVREQERLEVARTVHDELGQAATALRFDLAWLVGELRQVADETLRQRLEARTLDMLGQVDTVLQTVRRVAAEQRPAVLDDLGLAAAVEWYVAEFERRTRIRCDLSLPSEETAFGPDRSIAVFRILQEALTNVARHAGASRVAVALRRDDDHLVLEVTDNGRGITEEQRSGLRAFGLLGMRERAMAFGGEIQVAGSQGAGTTVTLTIPLKMGAGEAAP